MASAQPYQWERADGTSGRAWRACWTATDGARKSKRGFALERLAMAYATDREVEARHGVLLGDVIPTGKTTLEQWSQVWLSGLDVRPSTMSTYRYALKRILPALGGRPLSSLRASELRSWRRGLTDRMAPATADITVAILAMMLRAAVQDELIVKSPLPPASHSSTVRTVDPAELLSLEQVRAWGRSMPECAREMPLLAAMTGMRQGELLGLRLPRVDFLRRQVRVTEQLLTPAGPGRPSWGPPKTAAGVRTLPLPGPAAEALARHLARFPVDDDGPIFRTPTGLPWRRQHFRDSWRPALQRAGLPAWAHWHGLRDVYASSLIRQSVDIRTVMTLMGHTSSEQTLRVYARLWGDAQDNARRALEGLWDEPADGGRSVLS